MQLPVILRINLVTNQLILLCPKLLLMTEIDRYPTKAFTDVMGTCLGIAEHVTPVCSFPLSGLSITQIGAAAAGAAITKPTCLSRTNKRYAQHHYPLGGHSGAVICLLCAISANDYRYSTR